LTINKSRKIQLLDDAKTEFIVRYVSAARWKWGRFGDGVEEVEVATAAAAAEGRGHCGQLRGAGRPCAKSKLSGKTCPATIAHAREGVDIPVGFILSLGWLISGDTESASLLFRRTGYNKCSSHWVQQMLSNNSSITCFPHCCSITFVCCSMKTCFQQHGH